MKFPQRFFHRAQVNVPVEVAWDVFTNHERLGEFTSSPCRIIKEGSPDRNGLGCVRVLGAPEQGIPHVEEVVNFWHANKLFGYHVTGGAPSRTTKALFDSMRTGSVKPSGSTTCAA